jgi:hypothetical protein
MQDDTTKSIPLTKVELSLADENQQLCQENDVLTNKLGFFVELTQQLRDERDVLKGQKQRPKFPLSKLEDKQKQ